MLTMDSCCFPKIGEDDSVEKLKTWQDKGWVDLIITDVLEKETEELYGEHRKKVEEKTKSLSKDYGLPLLGHISSKFWFSPVNGSVEKFLEIYEVVFNEPWQEKAKKNNTRDALHLHTHLINDRDYFITRDSRILGKRDELECLGIKVRTSEAAIKEMEDYWRKNGIFPPEIITTPKIIVGTCFFDQFLIKKPSGSVNFAILKSKDDFFIFRGTLYSPNGEELIEFSEKPIIKHEKASLHAYSFESQNKNRIILDKKSFACVVATYNRKKILEARVLTKGHLLVQGEFFNKRGKIEVSACKEELRIFGPICL